MIKLPLEKVIHLQLYKIEIDINQSEILLEKVKCLQIYKK
jgi:hypothetical protein